MSNIVHVAPLVGLNSGEVKGSEIKVVLHASNKDTHCVSDHITDWGFVPESGSASAERSPTRLPGPCRMAAS